MRKTVFLIVVLILIDCYDGYASVDTLIMPQELISFAEENGCSQISEFYERDGMVNPPFVYGYLPARDDLSAAFWCKKLEKSEHPYILLFFIKDAAGALMKCPTRIEWKNYPGGLSVFRQKITLEGFVYINNPKRKAPRKLRMTQNAILSEYDGVSELFYCHQGEWLVRQSD